MKNILAVAAVMLFSMAAYGQTAKVIKIAPEDAAKAKAAYEKLQAAQTEWGNVQLDIRDKYLVIPLSGPEKGTFRKTNKSVGFLKYMWEEGFEFDSTFQFIVPKKEVMPEGCNFPWEFNTGTR